MRSTRSFRYLAALVIAGAAAVVPGRVQAQQPAPGGQAAAPPPVVWPPEQMAVDKYKNIQVLKDASADQVESAMHHIEAATGHKCVDCHVQEANGAFSFDKDDKRPKATAREMMKIVKTVNDEFFRGQLTVTCATCHKGARPVGQTPLASTLTPEQIAALMAPPQPPAGPAGGRGPGG